MGHILKIKTKQGSWINVPAIMGDSAYKIAVKKGFEGTEEEWLESLKGDKGEQGIPGVQGEPGEDGGNYVLTEADKKEIAGIAADMVSDEWINIADITTTEEVNSIFLTKDVDGNAFKCKRFVAKLKLPQSWSTVTGVYVGCGNDHTYAVPYTSFNTNGTVWGVDVYVELIENKCIVFEIHLVSEKEQFIGNLSKGKIVRTYEKESLESFRIAWAADTSALLPVGSTLKVWGLKQ